jgi:hypothetical protein
MRSTRFGDEFNEVGDELDDEVGDEGDTCHYWLLEGDEVGDENTLA